MKESITMAEIRATSTWSVKDNSPRGCKTVSNSEVKPGDMVVYENRFTLVVDDPETEAAETETEAAETAKEKTDRENWEHCKRIAEELDEITNGNIYRCPHCGELHEMTAYEETEHENEIGETCYTCPNCSEEIEESELEAVSIYDYFTGDIFDIEYRIGADKEYRSVRLMIACGGPNIYIDTAEKSVLLYWWTDRAEYPLSSSTCEDIDQYFEELFNC